MIQCIIIIYSVNDTVLNRTEHKTYLNSGTMQHQSVEYYETIRLLLRTT